MTMAAGAGDAGGVWKPWLVWLGFGVPEGELLGVPLLARTVAVWPVPGPAFGLAGFRESSTTTAAAARAATTRQPIRIGAPLPRRRGGCGGNPKPPGSPTPYCRPPAPEPPGG